MRARGSTECHLFCRGVGGTRVGRLREEHSFETTSATPVPATISCVEQNRNRLCIHSRYDAVVLLLLCFGQKELQLAHLRLWDCQKLGVGFNEGET